VFFPPRFATWVSDFLFAIRGTSHDLNRLAGRAGVMPPDRIRGELFIALIEHLDGQRARSCVYRPNWQGNMRRSMPVLIVTLLAILFAPLAADAQPEGKVGRVGILCVGICPVLPVEVGANYTALVEGLREAGYIDGQNLSVDLRGIGASYDQLPTLVAGLVQRKVDVIVALGSPASVQAAKNATTAIPIVMVGVAGAVDLGLVASLARPGGNVTGLTVPFAQLAAKQLELLKEADPRLSRVAVLWNPAGPQHGQGMRQMRSPPGL